MPLAPPPPATNTPLISCPRCGQILRSPDRSIPRTHRALCPRCHARLPIGDAPARSLAWPAALALAALILYPVAMALPILELHKLGHARETTILSGTVQLFTDGHTLIALIVFTCSIIIPLAKILGIFTLCLTAGRDTLLHRRHQAQTYHTIDWLGRWGMIDVLLVAILIAAVKLGDWVDVYPGPGIIAFAAVVVLSMLSSVAFDPRAIWQSSPDPAGVPVPPPRGRGPGGGFPAAQ